jgi:hypothetical protein
LRQGAADDFSEGILMTAPIAGYATAITALLFAAASALTLIYNVRRLDEIDEEPRPEEPAGKVAA